MKNTIRFFMMLRLERFENLLKLDTFIRGSGWISDQNNIHTNFLDAEKDKSTKKFFMKII